MEAVIDRQAAKSLVRHFEAINKHVPLRPIRSEADYDLAVTALNNLLDAGAGEELHPLADLAATLGELIGDYDELHYPAQGVSPGDMLRFLMTQHNIKQSELPEVGSQGVVSEVLSGKRELNLRQMKGLAQRFALPITAFFETNAKVLA
jgi:HTH-type transcriptional regulator / antitoxin HigA